jgi:IS5 family transposase
MQHKSNLSNPAMEVALIEVWTMLRFPGIELNSDQVPDGTAILTCGDLPKKQGLNKKSLGESRLTSSKKNAHVAKLNHGCNLDLRSEVKQKNRGTESRDAADK